MFLDFLLLSVGLFVILFAAELFTNSVEFVGDALDLSKNFTGSILAAVGTALPESILPVIAILFFHDNNGKDIGIGAILGAPFMLSTLAFPLIGLTILTAYLLKKRKFEIDVEEEGLRRDIVFFLIAYAVALIIVPLEKDEYKIFTALFLLLVYGFYVFLTIKGESEKMEEVHNLYFGKFMKPNLPLAITQLITSLVIMVLGAHFFVHGIEKISVYIGLPPLVFSLLLAPIATELPEKINSVLWTWRGKDTLAVGNVSGAMVFQSTIPVSIGIFLTDWHIVGLALTSGFFALMSAAIVLLASFADKNKIPIGLSFGFIFYLIYIFLVLKDV